jgi:hypothetical protein
LKPGAAVLRGGQQVLTGVTQSRRAGRRREAYAPDLMRPLYAAFVQYEDNFAGLAHFLL